MTFNDTSDFVEYVKDQNIIIYAHNGGKFDFMYLLPFVLKFNETIRAQIIHGRIVHMKLGNADLVDSFAAVPESLKNIKKRSIEFWKLERDVRGKHMKEIIHYLEGDCVYLHELMTAYRKDAGTKRTIASNALSHAKKLGIEPGTTNNRFDVNYRKFYFGGRTECFQPGTHRNISVFDIKSSYPFAMLHNHPSGNDMHRRSDLGNLTYEQIQRSFIILECYSNGAFPTRGDGSTGLNFPKAHSIDCCKDGVFCVTGWEYLAAKELGLIRDEKIIEVRYTTDIINFGPYIRHWYKYKNDHPKKEYPIEYTIGKILMNSLYGKMSENPEKYFDYKIMPIGSKLPCRLAVTDRLDGVLPRKGENQICKVCGFDELDHGWKLYTEFMGNEFHRREALWKYKYRYDVEWEAKPLYKNVATGASITGFARAYLLRAIHTIGTEHVIYCDTDSLVVAEGANTSGLKISNDIGDWELEISKAPLAHFGGKKLYAIEKDPSEPCHCNHPDLDCKRHKVVTKGAKLTFRDMENLVNGETIHYESKAPSFSLARGPHFIVRDIVRTS
jgi:DNA polymerase elongation subunit (family B)